MKKIVKFLIYSVDFYSLNEYEFEIKNSLICDLPSEAQNKKNNSMNSKISTETNSRFLDLIYLSNL